MIVIEPRYQDDSSRVVDTPQGRVLPELGNTCHFLTFRRIAPPVAFASNYARRHQRMGDCVMLRPNGPTRQTPSTTPATPNSA